MSDNLSNIHRPINALTVSEKELKKYSIVKTGDVFKKDDIISLYDDQYVKITESSKLAKYKVIKETIVYRRNGVK